jgi:DNA-binding Xre family transcriptional regulator
MIFVCENLSFYAGGKDMAFSYNKLWKLMIDKKMMKKDLIAITDITSSTMAKMGKDLPVSMEVLGRICKSLDVNIGDIVDYVNE